MKGLWFGAVFLLGASVSQANVFSFTYSGSGETVSGTITATSTLPGIYTITGISGTIIGGSKIWTITGLSSDPDFVYSGGSGTGSVDFNVTGSSKGSDTLSFAGSTFAQSGTTGTMAGFNFYLGSVPEPGTLLLFGTMGLGVWLLARKLPCRLGKLS